jgi:hypothetical protein
MSFAMPYVFCIDVGSPAKIGWADSEGADGTGATLADALAKLAHRLRSGQPVAIGFEAPIWTPHRVDLQRITSRRGGAEAAFNRPWSAGAGTGALGAALGLMPWCLTEIAKIEPKAAATVDPQKFAANGGLLLWEAFISGAMKIVGSTHHDDARLACDEFCKRWPNVESDIPLEPAINHAVSAAIVAKLNIDAREIAMPSIVVGVRELTSSKP